MNTMLQSPPSQPPGGIMPQQGQQNPLARLIQLLSGGGQTQGPQPQGPMFHIGPSERERRFNDERLAQAMTQKPTGPWSLAGGLAQVLAGKMRQNRLDKREEKAREGKYNALRDAMSTYTSGIQSLPEDMHGPPEQVGKGFSPQAYAAAAVETPGLDMGQFQRQAKIMVEMRQAQQESARENAQNKALSNVIDTHSKGTYRYPGEGRAGPPEQIGAPGSLEALLAGVQKHPNVVNHPAFFDFTKLIQAMQPKSLEAYTLPPGGRRYIGDKFIAENPASKKPLFSQAQLSENNATKAARKELDALTLTREEVRELMKDNPLAMQPTHNKEFRKVLHLARRRLHGDDPEYGRWVRYATGLSPKQDPKPEPKPKPPKEESSWFGWWGGTPDTAKKKDEKPPPSKEADNFLMGK